MKRIINDTSIILDKYWLAGIGGVSVVFCLITGDYLTSIWALAFTISRLHVISLQDLVEQLEETQ